MIFPPQPPDKNFELSPIKAIEIAASKIPGVISLAQGIPSFNTPQVIKDFVREKIQAGLCDKYSLTMGLAELREEIALALQRDGLLYDPETEIIVTSGSIEGITAGILAATSPGDEVLIPSPGYPSYSGSVYIARCTPRFFALAEDNNFDFQLDQIKRHITRKTKAILYCSPNNPTGTLFSEDKTRGLIEMAQKHQLTVIVDEVYKDFYYSDEKHFTPAAIPGARQDVIRVCSFSKAFAMTGWRVGFIHGDRSRIEQIVKYHDAMVTCAPVVSQYAAIAALRFGEPCLNEFKKEFKARRDFTIGILDQMSHVLDYQIPKATYFVFPRIKDTVPLAHDSRRLTYDILEKAKVAVVPGIAFGPSGEAHLRINFGRSKEDLETAMARLAEYFAKLKKAPSRPACAQRTAGVTQPLKIGRPPYTHQPKTGVSFLKQRMQSALAFCARFYLQRKRPKVIGVTGTIGKTVIKRILLELLKRRHATRSNILSYNTEIGLPLSILDLNTPCGLKAKLKFPLQLAAKTLFAQELIEFLILEYGINCEQDALQLCQIAVPDWLIISDLATSDPGIDCQAALSGVRILAGKVPAERIFWSAEDAWCREIRPDLKPELALSPANLESHTLKTASSTYPVRREFIGRSSKLAAIAAVMLAERLEFPKEQILGFLSAEI